MRGKKQRKKQTKTNDKIAIHTKNMANGNWTLACIAFVLGIILVTSGALVMSSPSRSNDRFTAYTCVVTGAQSSICGSSNGGSIPCGIVTMNATVCGTQSSSILRVGITLQEELDHAYPIGSKIPCWLDKDTCSVLSALPNDKVLGGGFIIALGSFFLLIGAITLCGLCCCPTSGNGDESNYKLSQLP